jgi:hypothetical protein
MKVKNISVIPLAGTAVALVFNPAAFAQCYPRQLRVDPAPVQASTASRSECLVRMDNRVIRKNERASERARLTAGQSYWFAASGCPRVGNIGIYVLNRNGQVLNRAEGYDLGFCFGVQEDDEYALEVKVLTLKSGYTAGYVDACVSKSGCRSSTERIAAKGSEQAQPAPQIRVSPQQPRVAPPATTPHPLVTR